MSDGKQDAVFGGSIVEVYDTELVPLIFEPYAEDLVTRLATRRPSRVLEIAAGTGVVTRAMAKRLPPAVAIVATDLNQAMLDRASTVGTTRPVEWRQADALALPFADGTFDAVVCQFGAMFFGDRPKAFGEVRRVLTAGGAFLFNVWDRIEANEVADVVSSRLAAMFPADPPRFLARTPYGYHDTAAIARDLSAGGFARPPVINTVAARSRAPSARSAAAAFCQGTPLRNEITTRAASRLDEAVDAVAESLAGRFGRGALDARMQAHVTVIES